MTKKEFNKIINVACLYVSGEGERDMGNLNFTCHAIGHAFQDLREVPYSQGHSLIDYYMNFIEGEKFTAVFGCVTTENEFRRLSSLELFRLDMLESKGYKAL